MPYYPDLNEQFMVLKEWIDLIKEQGGDADDFVGELRETLDKLTHRVSGMPVDKDLLAKEPDELDQIRKLRPEGPRVLELNLSEEELEDRILGAWMGRAAGCMLGVPCEGFSREDIKAACGALDIQYPLTDYWQRMPKTTAWFQTYNGLPYWRFIKEHIQYVMPDDDLLYTLLGLVILEEHGLDFTEDDVADAWLKYVPFACTAEKVALENLRAGLRPPLTAQINNPDSEWLGADIRSDPWGYAAPGMPELAAEYAWRDARVSHTRNGIYGEMFFSAVISAALATGDIRQSVEIGLTEIPKQCRLADAIRETLAWCDELNEYDKVLDRIFEKHQGMHIGHTINNAALTVAGLVLCRDDFEVAITQIVMGGMDTDCTAATAGSIAGAIWGAKRLPGKWIEPLGDVHRSYLNGLYKWSNQDIARRFAKLAVENRKRA